jgi:hypothetical protein
MPIAKMSVNCAMVYIAHSLINKGSNNVDDFIAATKSMGYDFADKAEAIKFWEKAAKKYVKPDTMLDEEFRGLKIDLAKEMMKLHESSLGDFVAGMYRAGIFSSVRTVQASLGGNLGSGILEEVANLPVVLYKALAQKSTAPITSNFKGIAHGFKSAFSKDTVNKAWDVMRHGATSDELAKFEFSNRLNYQPNNKLGKAFANVGNAYHNLVMNGLTAVDKPARIYHFNKSLMEQGIESALEKKLKPGTAAYDAYMKIMLEQPNDEMVIKAIVAGEEGVFGNSSKVVDALNFPSKFRQSESKGVRNIGLPIATAILPVVKFPVNGAMRTLEWVGGGWVHSGVKGKGRALTGAGLIYAGYKMAENGDAMNTVNPPYNPDAGLSDVREAAGQEAGALVIGGRNIKLNDLPQFATLAIGAMIYDYYKTSDAPSPEGMALTGAVGVGHAAMNLPAAQAFRKMEGFVRSIRPDERTEGIKSNKIVAGYGGGVVPEAFTDLANVGNPFMTGGRSFTDKFEASLGAGPIQFDVFGRPMARNQVGQWVRWWGKEVEHDNTVKEMARLNVPFAKPQRVIKFDEPGRDENEKQYQDRVWYVGNRVKKILDEYFQDKDFIKTPDAEKREILKKAVSKAKEKAVSDYEMLRIEARDANNKELGKQKSSGPSLFPSDGKRSTPQTSQRLSF